MENELDKTKPFPRKQEIDFLRKDKVVDGCNATILDVKGNSQTGRPVFYAQFPFGKFKFDLSRITYERFVENYKTIGDCIGKTVFIKAIPYMESKTPGALTLRIKPI